MTISPAISVHCAARTVARHAASASAHASAALETVRLNRWRSACRSDVNPHVRRVAVLSEDWTTVAETRIRLIGQRKRWVDIGLTPEAYGITVALGMLDAAKETP